MKSKIYLYSLIGLGATMFLTGCSDFLEPRNNSNANQDSDKYFAEHPEQIRPVAYDAVRYIANHIDMHDRAGDLYINPRSPDDGVFSMFTVNSADGTVADYYTKVMGGINKANAMIHYAGDKKELADEGRFLRILGYYYMTQQFGSVPYFTNYINDASRDFPRTPLDEIYSNLLSECDDLYGNSTLPDQDKKGYASKQAVAAIAAKIALAAAWDLDTELVNAEQGTYTVKKTDMFDKAAQWAEKAINNIPLTMSFEDKWSYKNEGNAEEIFTVQYDRAGYPGDKTSGGHSLMNNYISYYSNCTQTGLKGTKSGGTDMMSEKSASLFEKGDKRFEATFMTTFYNSPASNSLALWGKHGYMAFYNCTQAELDTMAIAMKFYPSETTVAEAEADIKKLVANGQAKKYAKGTRGVNEPFAAILSGNTVTKWEFNTAGTMPSKKTVDYVDFIREAANNGVCVRKYDDPEADNVVEKNCYRNIPLLHVSEMYLVAAEAYLLAGKESASLEKLNAVRERAGLARLGSFADYEAPYTTKMSFKFVPLDLVLDERARECYAERTRFHDLRRTKQLVRYNLNFSRFITDVSMMSNAKGEIKWYRPIPSNEISSNIGISAEDQNPGY